MTIDPKEAQRIVAIYDALHHPFDCTERLRSDPPLLAHYTSVETAEKIIKKEEIWLSHPFYMNDLEELRFGMLQGIQSFASFAEAAVSPNRRQELINHFNFFIEHMNEETLVNTYVLCLSEHSPDDKDGVLSMWRSYASQGHGVAIVFNTRRIPDPAQAPLRIAKVIYGSANDRIKLLTSGLVEWVRITKALDLPDNQLHLAAS